MRSDVLTRCTTVALRAAAGSDEPYVRRLFAASRPDLAILPADVREPLVDLQYRAQRADFGWRYPAAEYAVLVADGADAGLLVLDRGEGALRVVDLVVDERHRRRGVATAALLRVIDEAGQLPVRLSVWSANAPARALYERLGFVPTGAPVTEGYVAMERRPG